MAFYIYKARDKQGNIRQGIIEANSKKQVFDLLKKYNLLATSIIEKSRPSFLSNLIGSFGGISLKSKVIFSRQLATMINSGLSIIQALRILQEQEQAKNRKFAEVIRSIASDIEGGLSFSDSLVKFPKVFSPIYVSLVKSGEVSGKLDEVLDRLSTQMEKDYNLKSKVRGAMMYPAFIVTVMLIVAIVIITFVMPQLKTLFEESSTQLPLITKFLLSFSDFIRNYWWFVILILASFVFFIRYFLKTRQGKSIWDRIKLKIPIFGHLTKNIYMARFTRTLATLISSGLPILDSLVIVSDTVGNVHYQNEIREAAKQVESGINLSVPLEGSPLFPTMVSHMIEVGEKTGSIDDILYKLADFFDNEVNNMVNTLTTMLEPVLLVIMAIGVGFFVGAVLLPIYKLASAM